MFVFSDENWWQIDRSTSHSTARGNMIQVCCQSWFILLKQMVENIVKQMFKQMMKSLWKNIVKNMLSKQIVKYMDKYIEKQMLKQMAKNIEKIMVKNMVNQILNLMMKNIFSTFSLCFRHISSNAPAIAPVSSRKPLKPRKFVAIKYNIKYKK